MTENGTGKSEDYFDRIDRQKRNRRIVAVVLLVLLLTVSFILYLEISGSSGGEFIDRITVKTYLKRNYGSELGGLEVNYKGYNKVRKRYEYECSCEKGTFMMASKNFRVRFDGYYADFLCDKKADQAVLETFKSYLDAKWPEKYPDTDLEIKLRIRVPLTANADVSDVNSLLREYGNTIEFEFTLTGKKLSFGEYKTCSYALVEILRDALKENESKAPEFVQIFYYRTPQGGETDNVMSYESELYGFMVNYTEKAYRDSTDVNFVVELGESEQKSLRNYTIIRVVNFVVIGLVVIGLTTFVIVRRIRKKRKEV